MQKKERHLLILLLFLFGGPDHLGTFASDFDQVPQLELRRDLMMHQLSQQQVLAPSRSVDDRFGRTVTIYNNVRDVL